NIDCLQIQLDNGQFGGDGTVHTRFSMINSSQLTVGSALQPSPIQHLIIGNAGSTAGFSASANSSITINDQCSLTIQDLSQADAGIIIMDNATLTAANGLDLHANANVSGSGLIDADIEFTSGGSISPSGTGLRFG